MAGISLRALTFNAYHGYPLCAYIEKRLELLASALADEAPDIAILQEISVSTLYGHLPARLVDRLKEAGLEYHVTYSPANGSIEAGGAFEEGSAILSRRPIVEAEVRRLASAHPVWRNQHGYEYEEFRIAIRAAMEIAPGIRIDVFGTHITDADAADGASPRALQVADLAKFVDERPHRDLPAIVGGDFNARPDSAEVGVLRAAGFIDACDGCEVGPTNDCNDRNLEDPRDTANQRIDYVFTVGGHARVRGVRLFLDRAIEIEPGKFLWASDHSGIVADVDLIV